MHHQDDGIHRGILCSCSGHGGDDDLRATSPEGSPRGEAVAQETEWLLGFKGEGQKYRNLGVPNSNLGHTGRVDLPLGDLLYPETLGSGVSSSKPRTMRGFVQNRPKPPSQCRALSAAERIDLQ